MFDQMETGMTGLACFALAAAVVFLGAPGAATGAETMADGARIRSLLDDTTVAGNQNGRPWEQDFEKGGRTFYRAEGDPLSEGRWRIKGDRFCSQWPPSRAWTCYSILADGDAIAFVPDDGGDIWRARIKP
jgi:hypothetical protein